MKTKIGVGQNHNRTLYTEVLSISNQSHLIYNLVTKDIVTKYKHTVLGFAWHFIVPLMTALTYTVIFGIFGRFDTGNTPMILFYLSGVSLWRFFNTNVTSVANVFRTNSSIISKVYFPRIVLPVSITISNLFTLMMQLIVFIGFYLYFSFSGAIKPSFYILYFPLAIAGIAVLSMGLGMFFASWSSRYKDVIAMLGFSLSLLMFLTPVIYPLSIIPEKYLAILVLLNPLIPLFELFRFGWFGELSVSFSMIIVAILISTLVLILGTKVFLNKEKNVIDYL